MKGVSQVISDSNAPGTEVDLCLHFSEQVMPQQGGWTFWNYQERVGDLMSTQIHFTLCRPLVSFGPGGTLNNASLA